MSTQDGKDMVTGEMGDRSAADRKRIADLESQVSRLQEVIRRWSFEMHSGSPPNRVEIEVMQGLKPGDLAVASPPSQISVEYTCCGLQEFWPINANGDLELTHAEVCQPCPAEDDAE